MDTDCRNGMEQINSNCQNSMQKLVDSCESGMQQNSNSCLNTCTEQNTQLTNQCNNYMQQLSNQCIDFIKKENEIIKEYYNIALTSNQDFWKLTKMCSASQYSTLPTYNIPTVYTPKYTHCYYTTSLGIGQLDCSSY